MSWNSLRSTTRQCGSSEARHRRAEQRRHARQRLGGDQRALGTAMKILGTTLGRQRAAVKLEIHLADPDRQIGVVPHLRETDSYHSATLTERSFGTTGKSSS